METEPLEFETPEAMGAWLEANHASARVLWVRMHKVATGRPSVTWEQGIREALCWGWIDGVKRSEGAESWLQRFTPRARRSGWSQRNRTFAEALIAEGRMRPAGLAEVERAKADGRWDAAYAGRGAMEVPEDFLDALAAAPQAARAAYDRLGRSGLFAIYYRVTTAKKPETRARRIAKLVETLAAGGTLP